MRNEDVELRGSSGDQHGRKTGSARYGSLRSPRPFQFPCNHLLNSSWIAQSRQTALGAAAWLFWPAGYGALAFSAPAHSFLAGQDVVFSLPYAASAAGHSLADERLPAAYAGVAGCCQDRFGRLERDKSGIPGRLGTLGIRKARWRAVALDLQGIPCYTSRPGLVAGARGICRRRRPTHA